MASHELDVDGIISVRPVGGSAAGQQHIRRFFDLIDEDYSDATKATYRYDPERVYCDVCWLGMRNPQHAENTHQKALETMEAIRG